MSRSPSSTSSSDGVGPFIVRSAAFALLLAVLVGLGFLSRLGLESAALASFSGQRILVVGDSHAQATLDPAALGDAINAAQRAEPYVATYHKLRRLLRAWTSVRVVVLSYSPHNLSAFNDRKFDSPAITRELFDRYGLLLTPRSLTGLDVNWPLYSKSILLRTLLLRPGEVAALSRRHEVRFVGRFRPKRGSELKKRRLRRTVERHFYDQGKQLGVSLNAERHLRRIADLSAEKKIELFLVATPLHPDYRAWVPAEIRVSYRRVAEVLSRSRHVTFVDFSDIPLEARLYFDYDHVNGRGAKEVTARLAPLLGEALPR